MGDVTYHQRGPWAEALVASWPALDTFEGVFAWDRDGAPAR
jgi:hypothetical protein